MDMQWRDEDLLWEQRFDADPDFGIPFGWRVFVFESFEAMREASGEPGAYAYSMTYDEPDADGTQAIIMFGPDVPLSNVAHEALHVALFWARRTARPKQRAFSWLDHHPESVAELVGSLTAVTWYNIPAEHRDGSDDE